VQVSAGCDRWLEEHGNALYRYAYARFRDRAKAEDAVQETLLGALKNAAAFEGRSEVRTWLIGILRRKISDQFRKEGRAIEEPIDPLKGQFDQYGEWAAPIKEWADPDLALETAEFRRQFLVCLDGLPESYAEAFALREIEGMDYEAVCDELEISATNLSTRLYRARMLLRKCLEQNWFEGDRE
jgi:RNA polymerase sigma-70 factor (ECF subfamily)